MEDNRVICRSLHYGEHHKLESFFAQVKQFVKIETRIKDNVWKIKVAQVYRRLWQYIQQDR